MHIGCERLIEQLRRARSNGVVIGRDNLVSAAHLVANDAAETWRDVAGMLRVKLRVQLPPEPDRHISAQREELNTAHAFDAL